LRHRERNVGPPELAGKLLKWYEDGSPVLSDSYFTRNSYTAHIDDESHPAWRKGVRSGDVGGECIRIRESLQVFPSTILEAWRHGVRPAYVGQFTAKPPPSTFFETTTMWPEFASLGAQAYAKAKPAQPLFNGLNAFYELREIPKALEQRFFSGKHPLAGIGDLHLAYQFGWKPLFEDIRNFIIAHFNLKRALDQLIRDEGRPVHRTGRVLTEVNNLPTITARGYHGIDQGLVTQCYPTEHDITYRSQVSRTVRYSANFRYFLPEGPRDWQWTARLVGKLMGLDLTPSVVYRAIPWSWLVDWFSNVGSLIQNMEPGVADRVAAEYFYLIQEVRYVQTAEVSGTYFSSVGDDASTFMTLAVRDTQSYHRIKGNPFGFGLKEEDLSLSQLSILGALGMSRLG